LNFKFYGLPVYLSQFPRLMQCDFSIALEAQRTGSDEPFLRQSTFLACDKTHTKYALQPFDAV